MLYLFSQPALRNYSTGCTADGMNNKVARNQLIWQKWAAGLQHWGLQDYIATVLEITEPLNILGAQVVYLGQPFLNQVISADQVTALADLLENPTEARAFSEFIRQHPATENTQPQN
jgi:hypothetical protein